MEDQEKIKKIEEIHRECKEKLDALRYQQNEILKKYLEEIEENKMEALRNKLQ